MLNWIYTLLQKRLNQKKQEVIRLRWQQAELQRKLERIKK